MTGRLCQTTISVIIRRRANSRTILPEITQQKSNPSTTNNVHTWQSWQLGRHRYQLLQSSHQFKRLINETHSTVTDQSVCKKIKQPFQSIDFALVYRTSLIGFRLLKLKLDSNNNGNKTKSTIENSQVSPAELGFIGRNFISREVIIIFASLSCILCELIRNEKLLLFRRWQLTMASGSVVDVCAIVGPQLTKLVLLSCLHYFHMCARF